MYRALVWEERVSLAVLDTTALVTEAMTRHALEGAEATALGETLTATAYLCGWLKGGGLSVTLSGRSGKLVTVGDWELNLSGYVKSSRAEEPAPVHEEGVLTVSRDEDRGVPFTGTCKIGKGIADTFSAYFAESEQCCTAIALGVKLEGGVCVGAGGVFLQPLPGADELFPRALETAAAFRDVGGEIARRGALHLLRSVESVPYTRRRILFRCRCSRKRAEAAVLTLGRREAEEILSECGEISVHCEYCNSDYRFGPSEIGRLFTERS